MTLSIADVFRDFASRPIQVLETLPEIPEDQLNAHPSGHPNSIAWLLWHAGRQLDMQLAALTNQEEVWTREGHRERLGLGRIGDAMGYGHTAEEAHLVVVKHLQPLVDYLCASLRAVIAYADSLDDDSWDDIVDRSWEPPVSRATRLVSIVDDAVQHVAQVSYVLGMFGSDQNS